MRNKLLKHIALREGFKDYVYKDSLGFPTGGTGHKLTNAENKLYPVGSPLPKNLTDNWLREDMGWAEQAAIDQSSQVPNSTPAFQDALTSVNFQMGTDWIAKFPTAWRHMQEGDYERAISEIEYTKEGSGVPSLWAKQTPTRVGDFVSALTTLNEESEDMYLNKKGSSVAGMQAQDRNLKGNRGKDGSLQTKEQEEESGMFDDVSKGYGDYQAWAADNVDMLRKFMADVLKKNEEIRVGVLDATGIPDPYETSASDVLNKNEEIRVDVLDKLGITDPYSLDFGSTWTEKETGGNYTNKKKDVVKRMQQQDQDKKRQEEGAPVRDLSRMGDKIQYGNRPDRAGGNAPVRDLSTDYEYDDSDHDWGMSGLSDWFSDLVGEPSGKKPPRNSPRGK